MNEQEKQEWDRVIAAKDATIAELRALIDQACNALTDSIQVSGNNEETNMKWVRRLRVKALEENDGS